METTVFNLQGDETGKVTLPGVFETKVSPALLHEIVTGYLANQRAGTHSTKTRGEVSGGGRKPWREKGTGNARAGSNRSPLWRKGGIIFGPRPHSYYQNLSQQKRQKALAMALATAAKEGSLKVVDEMQISEPKTKKVAALMKKLNLAEGNIVFAIAQADAQLRRGSRNIPGLVIVDVKNLNAYQVLWADTIVFTAAALESLNK